MQNTSPKENDSNKPISRRTGFISELGIWNNCPCRRTLRVPTFRNQLSEHGPSDAMKEEKKRIQLGAPDYMTM